MAEELFPIEPVRFMRGQAVTVQTMWGDEPGVITDVLLQKGWPMAEVLMGYGDTISIDIARIKERRPGNE